MGALLNRRRYMGGGSADEIIMTSVTNPEVLAVCYAQGWCADANYMTKSEAEAVTSIGTVFRGNTSITHFEEFEYFISVTSIVENAFYDCTSLTSITFPISVVSTGIRSFFRCSSLVNVDLANTSVLGQLSFYQCASLESIDISKVHTLEQGVFFMCSKLSNVGDVSNIVTLNGGTYGAFGNTLLQGDYEFTNCTSTIIPAGLFYNVIGITNVTFPKSLYTEIGANAFYNVNIKSFVIREGCLILNNHSFTSSYMEYLDIPSTVTTWNGYACYSNSSQKVIVCRAVTPPTGLNSTNFIQVPSTCKVYVPNASISAYEAATGWSNLTGRFVPIEGSWYETHRSLCPYDAEVEYITIGTIGSEAFAISLELVPDSYTKSELDISVAGSRTPVVYGTSWDSSKDNNDYRLFWHPSNILYWDIGNKRVSLGMSSYYSYNERFKVILGNLYLTLPDKNKTVSDTAVAYTPYDQSELGFRNSCTIYGVKVWDTSSNSLLRDCIPVRVETTGYLYDKVRGQLCVNNITNITPGPDKT